MVRWILRQAHLQEVGLTQILVEHGSETIVNDCQGYWKFQFYFPTTSFSRQISQKEVEGRLSQLPTRMQ